jgi:hypothetical protein
MIDILQHARIPGGKQFKLIRVSHNQVRGADVIAEALQRLKPA